MTLTEKAILLIKGMIFLFKAKQGGKYLSRKRVVDKKTGKMRWGDYKYKPMQQRAAHEVTRNKFEKVTKLSGDEHKNQIEHALQNNIRVSLHVLRDYPDLAKKYGQIGRIEQADKIRARVKSHKEQIRMDREIRLNTPEGIKNNPMRMDAERMMREDGLIKDVKVDDSKNMNIPITENRFKKLDFGGSSNTYSKTATPETRYNSGVSIQYYKTGITLNFNYDKMRNKVTIGLHDSNKPARNATTEIETVTSLNQKRVDELLDKYIRTSPDTREVGNNFDTMPESDENNPLSEKNRQVIIAHQSKTHNLRYEVNTGKDGKFYTLQLIGEPKTGFGDIKAFHVQNLSKNKDQAYEIASKFAEKDNIPLGDEYSTPDTTNPHEKKIKQAPESFSGDLGNSLIELNANKETIPKEEVKNTTQEIYSENDKSKIRETIKGLQNKKITNKNDLPEFVKKEIQGARWKQHYAEIPFDPNFQKTSPVKWNSYKINDSILITLIEDDTFKFDVSNVAFIKTKFSPEMTEKIKQAIPQNARTWLNNEKSWKVRTEHLQNFLNVVMPESKPEPAKNPESFRDRVKRQYEEEKQGIFSKERIDQLKNNVKELEKLKKEQGFLDGVDLGMYLDSQKKLASIVRNNKSPDLKANFKAWKEERKQAPAFKLEADDLTSTEKLNRFNDKQGGLFGKKPQEKYVKKDFKPTLTLEGNESIESLVTSIKSALLKEGLDVRAREFVDRAFKEKDIASLKKMASEYVDVKESSQANKTKSDNKNMETITKEQGIKNIAGQLAFTNSIENLRRTYNDIFFRKTSSISSYNDEDESGISNEDWGKALTLAIKLHHDNNIPSPKESSQVPKPAAEDKGREEKKMNELAKINIGSDKQIAWAESIRQKAIKEFDNIVELPNPTNNEKKSDYNKVRSLRFEALSKISDSKFWINYRNFSIEDFLQTLEPEKIAYFSEKPIAIQVKNLIDKYK